MNKAVRTFKCTPLKENTRFHKPLAWAYITKASMGFTCRANVFSSQIPVGKMLAGEIAEGQTAARRILKTIIAADGVVR